MVACAVAPQAAPVAQVEVPENLQRFFAGKAQVSGGVAVSRNVWLMSQPFIGTGLSLLDRYEAAVTSAADAGPFLPAPERPVELLAAWRLGGERSFGVRLAGASLKRKT